MNPAETILNDALDEMIADDVPLGEAGLTMVLVGLDHLGKNPCCDVCLAEAIAEIRERLSELDRRAPPALH